MYKYLGFVAGLSMLAFAGVASAANITDVEFDGDADIQVSENERFDASVRIQLSDSEEVESVEVDLSDSRSPVCFDVKNAVGSGTRTISIDNIKAPKDEGNYDITVRVFGIDGAGANNDCDEDIGSEIANDTLYNVIEVDEDASNDDDEDLGGDDSSMPSWLKALFAALGIDPSKPTPSKPAYCAGIVWYNGMNAAAAQASLLATPHASSFHNIGVYAPTGHWGNASMSANASATAACK